MRTTNFNRHCPSPSWNLCADPPRPPVTIADYRPSHRKPGILFSAESASFLFCLIYLIILRKILRKSFLNFTFPQPRIYRCFLGLWERSKIGKIEFTDVFGGCGNVLCRGQNSPLAVSRCFWGFRERTAIRGRSHV